MIFTVSTATLLSHLQLVQGAVGVNSSLPILEDFLFTLSEGNLRISATDLETSMSTSLDVMGQDDGSIAIPARILTDVLKTLPDQPLTFKIDTGSQAIEIVSSNGNYKLLGEPGEDFPTIASAGEEVTNLQIDSDIIGRAIAHCLFAVSSDELRPAMTGVYFQIEEDSITFVATDAHKLVRYKRTDAKGGSATTFILPKKALTLLGKALPSKATPLSLSYDATNAFFSFEGVHLSCRLIDARYPDYTAVIPAENPNKVTVNRLDIQNALKRISIFSNKTTYQVVLDIDGEDMTLSAQDIDYSNEAKERLTCASDGAPLKIAFNARFLVEILGVLSAEEVVLNLSTPQRAGIIVPAEKLDDEDILMLVMPIMLNN